MSAILHDGDIFELVIQFDGQTFLVNNYRPFQKYMQLEPQLNLSKLRAIYKIELPSSTQKGERQEIRTNQPFYLRNLFSEEYMTVEETSLRQPSLIKTLAPGKMFCLTKSEWLQQKQDQPIRMDQPYKLTLHPNQGSLRLKKTIGKHQCYDMTFSDIEFDRVILRECSLTAPIIEKGYIFTMYSVQNGVYAYESMVDGKLKLNSRTESPLVLGKFFLEPYNDLYYLQSLYLRSLLDFKNGKPILTARKSDTCLFRLHMYSQSTQPSQRNIYILQHQQTGQYLGYNQTEFLLTASNQLQNALQLNPCSIDSIRTTGFFSSIVQVFNSEDGINQEKLKIFLTWVRGKMHRYLQAAISIEQQLQYSQLQLQFFQFDLVNNLLSIYSRSEEAAVKKQILNLISMLCKNNTACITRLLSYKNFIVSAMQQKQFDLVEVLSLSDALSFTSTEKLQLATKTREFLLYLNDTAQDDDSNIHFLQYLRYTIQLSIESSVDIKPFQKILLSYRKIKNYTIVKDVFTSIDRTIMTIFVLLAGKKILPEIPLPNLISIVKNTEVVLDIRRMCLDYIIFEHLQSSCDTDMIVFEVQQEAEDNRHLANYSTSLKQYCMSQLRQKSSEVKNCHIISVIYLEYMVQNLKLETEEILEASHSLTEIIEQMEVIQEEYEKEYEFLTHSISFLSLAKRQILTKRRQNVLNQCIRSPMIAVNEISKSCQETLNEECLDFRSVVSKICYFIKLSGNNLKNCELFLKNQDLFRQQCYSVTEYYNTLRETCIIKEFDTNILQLYGYLKCLGKGKDNTLDGVCKVLSKIKKVLQEMGHDDVELVKAQVLMRNFDVGGMYIDLLSKYQLPDSALSDCLDILKVYVEDSLTGCMDVIRHLKQFMRLVDFRVKDYGQYGLLDKIISNKQLKEIQYLDILYDIITKREDPATPDENIDYIWCLVSLTKSERHLGIQRIVKSICRQPQLLNKLLRITNDRGFKHFSYKLTQQHFLAVTRFLHNLIDFAALNKDFRQVLTQNLPQEIYSKIDMKDSFFQKPHIDSHTTISYITLLVQIICSFGLLRGISPHTAEICISSVLQTFISCFRSIKHQNLSKIDHFYTANKKWKIEPLIFAAQVLTMFMKQVQVVALLLEKELGEETKQSILRANRILAGEVVALYEQFLQEPEYLLDELSYNESFKILNRHFGMEPTLKFYFNYQNAKPMKSSKFVRPDNLCKRSLEYLGKSPVQRSLIVFLSSQTYKDFLSKEKEKRRRKVKEVLNDVGSEFVVQCLMFCLQESSISRRPGELGNFGDLTAHTSNMMRSGKAICNLLTFDSQNMTNLFLNSGFGDMLLSCFAANLKDAQLLLNLAIRMLTNENGQLNISAQKVFQNAFLGPRQKDALRYMRRILTNQLNLISLKNNSRNSLERQFQLQIFNRKQNSETFTDILKFIELMCQSLNFDIKDAMSEIQHKSKSILVLILEILDKSVKMTFNNFTKHNFLINVESCEIIEGTFKAIISMLHGPHQKNIKIALFQNFQEICTKILSIDDSLQSIYRTDSVDSTSRVFQLDEILTIKKNYTDLYDGFLESALKRREPSRNYELLSRLKQLAITSINLLYDQSIRYKTGSAQERCELAQKNLIELNEKLRAVYNVQDEQLIRLLYAKESKMNIFQKIMAFDIFQEQNEKEKILEAIKPSLTLQFGIQLYNYLFKHYKNVKNELINNAVYKYVSSQRLNKRFNKKIGFFYQIYNLVKDILNIFIWIFRRLCKNNKASQSFSKLSRQQKLKSTLQFFAQNFQTIEIRLEDGKKTNVCFPLVPESRCFTKSIKRDLQRHIDYNSDFNRLHSFMNYLQFIVQRLGLEYKLSRITEKNKGLGVLIKYRELWKSLSFFVGFLQNLILLLQDRITAENYQNAMYVLRTTQYVLAAILFVIFLFQSAKLRIILAQKYCEQKKITRPFVVWLVKAGILLTDKTFVYSFFYTTLTAIGSYFPLFLCLMLLDFFFRFKSARFLTQLTIKPGWSFITNFIFFIILIYMYSFILIKNPNYNVQATCKYFLECLQIEIWLAMGILGSKVLSQKQFDSNFVQLLENTMFIVVLLIYRALFLSIVINQKSKLRINNQKMKDKVELHCFICGSSKENINKIYRSDKGFKKHIEMEHNMWNYISYLVYVEKLKHESMTAQEQYIQSLWKVKSIDWLPYVSLSKQSG